MYALSLSLLSRQAPSSSLTKTIFCRVLPPKAVARYRHVCPRQTPLQSGVHFVAHKSRVLSISDRLYHRRFIQHLDSALDTLVQQCNALSLNDDIAWRHAYAVYLMPLNRPCACTRICTRSDVRRPVPRPCLECRTVTRYRHYSEAVKCEMGFAVYTPKAAEAPDAAVRAACHLTRTVSRYKQCIEI